jgi:hypothetical protein
MLSYREPAAPWDVLTEAVPVRDYPEGSALNLARAALLGVEPSRVPQVLDFLRAYRGREGQGNSLITGGALSWEWKASLAAETGSDHHGDFSAVFAGPHHAHGQLSGVGIDDHHARDHATRHDPLGADALSTAYFRTDGSLGLAGNLLPDLDAARDLGSPAARWRYLYLSNNLYFDTDLNLSRTTAGTLEVTTPSGYVRVGPENTTYCHFLTDRVRFYFNKELAPNGRVWPFSDAVYDLGSSGRRWRDGYFSSSVQVAGVPLVTGWTQIDTVNKTGSIGASGVWTDIDCSADVPAGAKAVQVVFANAALVDDVYHYIGVRKNGSTDTMLYDFGYDSGGDYDAAVATFTVELDASRVFEAYMYWNIQKPQMFINAYLK